MVVPVGFWSYCLVSVLFSSSSELLSIYRLLCCLLWAVQWKSMVIFWQIIVRFANITIYKKTKPLRPSRRLCKRVALAVGGSSVKAVIPLASAQLLLFILIFSQLLRENEDSTACHTLAQQTQIVYSLPEERSKPELIFDYLKSMLLDTILTFIPNLLSFHSSQVYLDFKSPLDILLKLRLAMGDARPALPEAHAHTVRPVCFHESCICVDATQTGYAIRKVTMQQAPMQLQQGFRIQ